MKYTVLGITDERTSCDCCGRIDLKKTVAMNDNETGEIVYFGTSCATSSKKYTSKDEITIVKADIKTAKSKVSEKFNQLGYERDERAISLLIEFENTRAYETSKIDNITKRLKAIHNEYKLRGMDIV